MFDVAHEKEEIVTEAERQLVQNIKPKTIQDVFKKTRVYVEVRSGDDDLTQGIQSVLKQLGATISNTLGKTTTHVVFKDGLNSTYTKAKKMEIPVVSVLWIEACRKLLILADPKKYPISNLERYENPELFKRVKRPKVMTPKLKMTQVSRFSLSSKGIENESKVVSTPKEQNTVKIETKTEINVNVNKESDKTMHKPVAIMTPKVSRRQTIHIATPRPTVEEISNNVTLTAVPNIWMKAVDNIHRVAALSNSMKGQEDNPKHGLFNLVSPDFDRPKLVNKRRTLYTPEPHFTPKLSTPKTLEAKPTNKRRTLFTPEPTNALPTVNKSVPRRRTLFVTTPGDKAAVPVKLPHTVSKGPTSSKRKFPTESKENTPPRLKHKPILTPSSKQLLVQNMAKLKVDPVTTPEVPANKRRRTLFMAPELVVKC